MKRSIASVTYAIGKWEWLSVVNGKPGEKYENELNQIFRFAFVDVGIRRFSWINSSRGFHLADECAVERSSYCSRCLRQKKNDIAKICCIQYTILMWNFHKRKTCSSNLIQWWRRQRQRTDSMLLICKLYIYISLFRFYTRISCLAFEL